MKYINYILPNKAKIRYVKNKINQATHINVNFDCGARCDTIAGLAHFTEHMFFAGTKDLSKEDITKLDSQFPYSNAYTNLTEICFCANMLEKDIPNYLDLLAKKITESNFTMKAVKEECKIIQQEITRASDRNKMYAHYANMYNITGLRAYKEYVMGSKESVAKITPKEIKEFVKKYFVKENVKVYITTPMSFKKVKKLLITHLINKLNSNPDFKPLDSCYADIKSTDFFKVEKKAIDKCYLMINFLAKPCKTDEMEFRAKYNVVHSLLNDSVAGIINDLRIKKSLVYSADFSSSFNDKYFRISFNTECEAKNINEILKTSAEYFKNIHLNGFSQQVLDRVKVIDDYYFKSYEPTVVYYLNNLYYFDRHSRIYDNKYYSERYKNTTLQQCNEIFNYFYNEHKISVTIYGNADKKELLTKTEFQNLYK